MTHPDRYARQTMLAELGPAGQQRLRRSAALIVGLGGLGSPVALYLTGAGVGRIGLCDADTVSASNLQRQTLYDETQTGMPKTAAAASRLAALNSEVKFDQWPQGLTPDNARHIIAGYDIVIDCCDNFATRFLIADTCAALEKPWVYGSIGAFHGQVTTFMPRQATGYADLYPDRQALCAIEPSHAGVLGAVPGVVGAIQAAEALKLLAQFGTTLAGRLLTINLSTMQFNTLEL